MGNSLDFDRAKTWLEDNDAPDYVKQVFEGAPLRKEITAKEAELEEVRPFREKYEKLLQAPKVLDGFKQHANVDVDELTDLHKAWIEEKFSYSDDAEDYTSFASKWKLPVTGEAPAQGSEQPAAAGIAAQAQSQPGSAVPPQGNPQTIADIEEAANAAARAGNHQEAKVLREQATAAKDAFLRPEGLVATT